jgi:hypothetical protein
MKSIKSLQFLVFKTLLFFSLVLKTNDGSGQETLVALNLFWNAQVTDNATAIMNNSWSASGYINAGGVGYILINQETGTIPLRLYWSEARKDYATMAGAKAEQDAIDAGYTEQLVLGYIFTTQRPGTIPLKLYWSESNADNMTVPEGKDQGAINAGYHMARIIGYVYNIDNTRLQITFGTGSDDLAPTSHVFISINYADGSHSAEYDLGGSFATNSTITKEIVLNRRVRHTRDYQSVTIRQEGRRFDPRRGVINDTWNLNSIFIGEPTFDGPVSILSLRGNPLQQFTNNSTTWNTIRY